MTGRKTASTEKYHHIRCLTCGIEWEEPEDGIIHEHPRSLRKHEQLDR